MEEEFLVVDRKALITSLEWIRKVAKARGQTDAYVSFTGEYLRIQVRIASTGVPATGTFTGTVAANAVLLTRIAEVLPKTSPITVRTDGSQLYFDTLSITCRPIDVAPSLEGPLSNLTRKIKP